MKNKTTLSESLIKHGGYHKIPNKIYHLNLPLGAIAIYNYLLSCSENFNPPGRAIATVLKISRTTVHKHLALLCKYNLIRCIDRGGKNKTTLYEFTNPKDWKTLLEHPKTINLET